MLLSKAIKYFLPIITTTTIIYKKKDEILGSFWSFFFVFCSGALSNIYQTLGNKPTGNLLQIGLLSQWLGDYVNQPA